MKSLLLVWVALRRKPAATLLICAATTAAFTLFGVMVGLFHTRQQFINSARMDQIFVNMRYPDNPYTGFPLAVGDEIAQIRGVAAVGAFKWLGGYRKGPKDEIGIFTVSEGMRHARPDEPITPRQWDLLFSTPDGVLVTEGLAKQMDLREGDAFPITTGPGTRADGGTTWTFQVLAVVPEDPRWPTGVMLGNATYIDSTVPITQRYLGYSFELLIKDASRAEEICRLIDRRFANSATPTYSIPAKVDAQENAKTNIHRTVMMLGTAAAGLFMILFLVANAVARSVHERMPEFALLSALGFREARLGRLVFMEAAFPCLFGAVLGIMLAAALIQIPASFLPSGFSDSTLTEMATSGLPPVVLVWGIGAAALLACLSTVVPLMKLGCTDLADVLAAR